MKSPAKKIGHESDLRHTQQTLTCKEENVHQESCKIRRKAIVHYISGRPVTNMGVEQKGKEKTKHRASSLTFTYSLFTHCATDFSSGCVPLAVPPLLDICLPLRLLTISCKGELHYSYANGSHYGGTKCKSQKSRDFSVGMLRRAMTSEQSNTLNLNQRHVVTQCTCSAVWVYL